MGNLLRKIAGAPNSAFRALARKLIVDRLSAYANTPFMLAVKGKKTLIGSVVGLVGFGATALGFESTLLGDVGLALAALGLVDKSVHEPGRPEWATSETWYGGLYRFAADHAAYLSGAFMSGFAYVVSSGCESYMIGSFALTCTLQARALVGAAIVLAYIGILDVGLLSKVPASLRSGTRR